MNKKQSLIELSRAFNEARLCAMHIDLQDLFYFKGDDYPTDKAFTVANKFAQSLREIDVPNYWIACLYEAPDILPYEHLYLDRADFSILT